VGTSPRQQRAKREEKADAFNIIAPERGQQRPFSLTCTYKPTPAAVRDKTQKTHKKVPNLLLSHLLHDYQYCCLQV
jgi:hypothetical protein